MTEPNAVDPEQMRIWGHKMVDMVADYWTNIRDFKPQSSVQPGYISNLVPTEAPEIGESLEQITKDIPEVIMNGVRNSLSLHCYHFLLYDFN